MVDMALVLRKLASLADYRRQIAEYSSITVEEYRSDWMKWLRFLRQGDKQ